MLRQVLDAHDGVLPPDVHVLFSNTGKERPETLRFVHDVEAHWGVKVHWLEWRRGKPIYEEVGFNSASRNGEPFEALIRQKQITPNGQARWCTQYLKVEIMAAFNVDCGWTPGEYAEVIGLRADEPWRVAKMKGRNVDQNRNCIAPMFSAGVTKADVLEFWKQQPFDLQLEPWESNCDLCFLKGAGIRRRIMRDRPDLAQWWIDMEVVGKGKFTTRQSYAELLNEVRRAPMLFDPPTEEEYDVECGLLCEPEDAETV